MIRKHQKHKSQNCRQFDSQCVNISVNQWICTCAQVGRKVLGGSAAVSLEERNLRSETPSTDDCRTSCTMFWRDLEDGPSSTTPMCKYLSIDYTWVYTCNSVTRYECLYMDANIDLFATLIQTEISISAIIWMDCGEIWFWHLMFPSG